ncbi:MAG TPA: alpha/beta hydrolase, partial [Anaerolineae bacterium]|nr:alpha/beta hydrolase [Anaerolineae bacterium]
IVGHSFGGLVGMALARLNAVPLGGLVLLCTPLCLSDVNPFLRLLTVSGLQLLSHHVNQAQMVLRGVFEQALGTEGHAWRTALAQCALATHRGTLLRMVDEMLKVDWRAVAGCVSQLPFPTSVLLATRDRTVNTSRTRHHWMSIDESPALVPAGHMVPIERPDQVAAAVRSLLARV